MLTVAAGDAAWAVIDCRTLCNGPNDRVYGFDASGAPMGAVQVQTGLGCLGSVTPSVGPAVLSADDLDSAICPNSFFCGVNASTVNFNDPNSNYGAMSLNGLRCLRQTAMVSNASMTALSANNLTDVGDDILVWGNTQLGTFRANSLVNLGQSGATSDLDLTGNPVLTQLDLPALTTIFGALIVDDNRNLIALNGFPGLTLIQGRLSIDSNRSLNIGIGLAGLLSVGDSVLIRANPQLTQLTLSSLVTVGGGALEIRENSLQALTLSALTVVTDVIIASEAQLAGLGPAWPLVQTLGSLKLLDNTSLINLAPLAALATIGVDLELDGNTSLVSAAGLAGVSGVGGTIKVYDNFTLPTFALPLVPAAFAVQVRNNTQLIQLDLTSLTAVTDDVVVFNNRNLPDLGWGTVIGFPNLAGVGGAVKVDLNQSLQVVNLPNLNNAGSIQAQSNAALSSVRMPVLTVVGSLIDTQGDLTLLSNPALQTTNLAQLATVGARIRIWNNTTFPAIAFPSLAQLGDGLEVEGNMALGAVTIPGAVFPLACFMPPVPAGACGINNGQGAQNDLLSFDQCVDDGNVPQC